LGYQQYIFPQFYNEVLSFLPSQKDDAGNELTIREKLLRYFSSNPEGGFSYYFRNLSLVYYKSIFKIKKPITLESPAVVEFAKKMSAFRLKAIKRPLTTWYELSKSILGPMSELGFTNISIAGTAETKTKWRGYLESAGAGYSSTEKQCEVILGPHNIYPQNQSKCSFCGIEFTSVKKKCIISCEHLLEVGLLTFLVGITPNVSELVKQNIPKVQKNVTAYFKSLGCYFWACERCNSLKSNVQTTKKNYGEIECSIFVKFNREHGFRPNKHALEDFCAKVIDPARKSNLIDKCQPQLSYITQLKNNVSGLNVHMTENVVTPITIALNGILDTYYGTTKSEQLASALSIGLMRYAKLDMMILEKMDSIYGGSNKRKPKNCSRQFGGGELDDSYADDIMEESDKLTIISNEIQPLQGEGSPLIDDPQCKIYSSRPDFSCDIESIALNCKQTCAENYKLQEYGAKFISKTQVITFLKNIMLDGEPQQQAAYLFNNIEDFSESFNTFSESITGNFDLLSGLYGNLMEMNKESAADGSSPPDIFQTKLAKYQSVSNILIKSLCTYSNFETAEAILIAFFGYSYSAAGGLNFNPNSQNSVKFLNAYVNRFTEAGMTQQTALRSIHNLFTDLSDTRSRFKSSSYALLELNNAVCTVFFFENYVYIMNIGAVILGKILRAVNESNVEIVFDINNIDDAYYIQIEYFYSFTSNGSLNSVQPGALFTLSWDTKEEPSPNIKDICVSVCGHNLITVDPHTNQIAGKQKYKKTRGNKKNYKKYKTNKKSNKTQKKRSTHKK